LHFGLEVGGEDLDRTVIFYTSNSVPLRCQSSRSCDRSRPSVLSPICFPSPKLWSSGISCLNSLGSRKIHLFQVVLRASLSEVV